MMYVLIDVLQILFYSFLFITAGNYVKWHPIKSLIVGWALLGLFSYLVYIMKDSKLYIPIKQ